VLFSIYIFPQQVRDSITVLKNELETFQYSRVVENADSLIGHTAGLAGRSLIEIYALKAIAQYSLINEKGAKESFVNILKIDSTFTLDPASTSPKIIAYFNEVKKDYLKSIVKEKTNVKVVVDTVYVPKVINDESSSLKLKQALVRSMLWPGFGHFYLNQNLKGTILTSLTAVTLFSTIYFVIKSNKKQRNYLNTSDNSLIQSNYDAYNTSYKMKNASIIALAVVWLYSQLDILFFSHDDYPIKLGQVLNSSGQSQFGIQFKF
jgi:TM2 domain-containing membrane protein YozV